MAVSATKLEDELSGRLGRWECHGATWTERRAGHTFAAQPKATTGPREQQFGALHALLSSEKSADEQCHVWFVELLAGLRLDQQWVVLEERAKELRALEEASSESLQRETDPTSTRALCRRHCLASYSTCSNEASHRTRNPQRALMAQLPESGTPARRDRLKTSLVAMSLVSKVLEREIEQTEMLKQITKKLDAVQVSGSSSFVKGLEPSRHRKLGRTSGVDRIDTLVDEADLSEHGAAESSWLVCCPCANVTKGLSEWWEEC